MSRHPRHRASSMPSCASGWSLAPTGSCYHLTLSAHSHAGCIESCGLLNATLACITSDPEQIFASSIAAVSSGADAWIGHYHANATSPTTGWDACASGEIANETFAPWAPLQPNAASESCVALWAEYEYLWRDAPCSSSTRCLCEHSSTSTAAASLEYIAFAGAEQALYEEQLSMATSWLLLIYLLVAPAISLTLLLCLYLCSRRAYAKTTRAASPRSAHGHPTTEPSSVHITGIAGASASASPQPDDETTVATLRVAEQTAHQLWLRVCGSLLLLGMFSFWWTTASTGFAYFDINRYRAVKLVTGNVLDYIHSLVPWSLALFGLALRPTDAVGITRTCNSLFAFLFLVCLIMIAYFVFSPGYGDYLGEAGAPVMWILLISFIFIDLAMLPVTSCCASRKRYSDRERLQRFWLCVRASAMVYAVFSLYSALWPLFQGYRLVITGRGERSAFVANATSCALASIVLTPKNRGRCQLWLGSHFLTTRGGKQQEASFLAGLIRGTSAADAYVAARALFRGLPITSLPGGTLFAGPETYIHESGSPNSLRDLTEPAVLGEVAAFVSHSWSDDADARLAQLQAWADAQPAPAPDGRPAMVWIDRCCFDRTNIALSLTCLPIYIAGCKTFLVLAGPTFSSRLWCALEVFVFVRMGGKTSDIAMRLAVPTGGTASEQAAVRESTLSSLSKYDAGKAHCFKNEDRQRILAVIEASFGSPAPFNELVRSIFNEKLQAEA